ncbi:YicC family protein [bacterium]|nr:YicC family protein [bacterium]
MIRSMTGYSSVRETIGEALVSFEIKTLNHRNQDLHFHSPRSLSMLESPIRDRILKKVRRGRIEIYLRVIGSMSPQETIRVNLPTAKAYLNAAQKLADELQLQFQPKIENVLNFNGVLEVDDSHGSADECWPLLQGVVEKAVDRLLTMKLDEGARLLEELKSQLDELESITTSIEPLRNQVINEYRDKLLARIQDWEAAPELDPNRVAQEVAFFVDRSDIQEETVRLKSHIKQFRDILNENKSDAEYTAVGRRLDFLCQELFREANTIGSKSAALEITQRALRLKTIIEQVREQVQNVE